jgi:hypothetical protein
MIDRTHPLPIKRQAALVGISRGPYLLRGMAVEHANQAWAMDITYIPMARGSVYFTAMLDWASRRVLAHRVSITMEADFCVEALREAIARYGVPGIMNTDQGSQFTGREFTDELKAQGIAIGMDGRGQWRDSVRVAQQPQGGRVVRHQRCRLTRPECGKPHSMPGGSVRGHRAGVKGSLRRVLARSVLGPGVPGPALRMRPARPPLTPPQCTTAQCIRSRSRSSYRNADRVQRGEATSPVAHPVEPLAGPRMGPP